MFSVQCSVKATLAAGLLAALVTAAQAQFPTARLDSIFPLGAKVGSNVEVSVSGANLDGPRALISDHPGIKGTPAEGGKFKVEVAADVEPGVYGLRFAGQNGTTAPCWFTVGEREEQPVPKDAGDKNKAPALATGTVYNGQVDGGRAHFFKISIDAGGRVFIDCFAERIGSRLDASLVLFAPSGQEVARSREAVFGDPLIDFTAGEGGEYLLRVSDFLARGGAGYGYRLVVRQGPQIDYVLPASARAGSKQTFEVFGRNLPGGSPSADGLERIEMAVDVPANGHRDSTAAIRPAAAGAQGFHFRIGEGAGASNAIFIAHSEEPVLTNSGSNAKAEDAQQVAVPSNISGRFHPGAVHWFRFEVKGGQSYVVDAMAHRLGAPSDPVLEVFMVSTDGEGKESRSKIGGGDDETKSVGGKGCRTDHRDPVMVFTAKADGAVLVSLRDQFGTSTVFRLSVRESRPDFDLIVSLPQPVGDPKKKGKTLARTGSAMLRGEIGMLPVFAIRRDGFNGDIDLSVEGLPPSIKAGPAKLSGGQDNGSIPLQIDPGAPAWAGAVKVVGRAKVGDRELVKAGESVSLDWEVKDFDQEPVSARLGSMIALASVEEETPIQVAVTEQKTWETAIGGKVDIPVKITAKGEIKDKTTVRAVNLPGVGNKPMQLTIDKGKDTGTLSMQFANNRDNNKFTAGEFHFVLQASTKMGVKRGEAEAKAAEEAKKKAVAEADAKRKERDQAKTDLDNARKAGGDEEAKKKAVAEAEAKMKAAEEASKKAEAAKKSAEDKAKKAAEAAKPRDLQVSNYSMPVAIKLAATPLKMNLPASPAKVAKGAKVELPVNFERLYGFADEVRIRAQFPNGTKGVSAKELVIKKEAGDGMFVIETGGDAAPGELAFEWVAKVKFNGIDVESRTPAKLIISES